ncbi:hypothetical protein ACJX0J_025864, partial [Zea mays]
NNAFGNPSHLNMKEIWTQNNNDTIDCHNVQPLEITIDSTTLVVVGSITGLNASITALLINDPTIMWFAIFYLQARYCYYCAGSTRMFQNMLVLSHQILTAAILSLAFKE